MDEELEIFNVFISYIFKWQQVVSNSKIFFTLFLIQLNDIVSLLGEMLWGTICSLFTHMIIKLFEKGLL